MKTKKLIAPIVVTCLLVAILLGYAALCLWVPLPLWLKIVGCLVIAALAGVVVFVLVERIQEVRSGEEDDLSQY